MKKLLQKAELSASKAGFIFMALVLGIFILSGFKPQPATKPNSGLPVGTVVSSYLGFKEFCASTGEPTWTLKNQWAPCDGRNVPGSKFAKFSQSVPDLRGVFIRGLNDFDLDYHVRPTNDQLNLEVKHAGEYQNDKVGTHQHQTSIYITGDATGPGALARGGIPADGPNGPRLAGTSYTSLPDVKTENTVKNVSLYYYIKIN